MRPFLPEFIWVMLQENLFYNVLPAKVHNPCCLIKVLAVYIRHLWILVFLSRKVDDAYYTEYHRLIHCFFGQRILKSGYICSVYKYLYNCGGSDFFPSLKLAQHYIKLLKCCIRLFIPQIPVFFFF